MADEKALFSTPTIVQNYPSDHPLPMDGADFSYEAIKKLIDSAKVSLDISPFYIHAKPGSKLNTYILQTIFKKAEEGVKVRILVDKHMASEYPEGLTLLKGKKNIELFETENYNKNNGVNHAKMIIVDDSAFYLGSHNFSWVTFELNHELGVIYHNPSLTKRLKAVFESDWKTPSSKKVEASIEPQEGMYRVSTSPQFPGVLYGQDQFLQLINNAVSEINMQAMNIFYYDSYMKEDWVVFKEALVKAAKRGVKVRMMMSNWEFSKYSMDISNAFLQSLLTGEGAKAIEIKFSAFPPHKPCVPFSEVDHAKYMIVDGKNVWIGTGNLSKGYFHISRDYSFFAVGDKALGHQMNAIFYQMWNGPYTKAYLERVTKPTNITCKKP